MLEIKFDESAKLNTVIRTVSSTLNYESIYVFGSHARKQQKAQSDLDVLVLVRLPNLIRSIHNLRPIFDLRKYGVDMNIISTFSLRGTRKGYPSPLTPMLLNWKRQSVLIAGRDSLPTINPFMDRKSFALFACRVSRWFLGFISSQESGIRLGPAGARWLEKQANNMIENCKIKGVPPSWGVLGERLREEVSQPNPDVRVIFRYFADMLQAIRKDIRFSKLDQALYFLTVLVERRKALFHTLFADSPVQIRFFDALVLLFRSASFREPDRLMISESLRLIHDHIEIPQESNPYIMWKTAQRILLEYLETALRLPLGTLVFNKGPRYPRIVLI